MTTTRTASHASRWIFAGLFALFAWAYWTTLVDLKHHWDLDPLYSHGYLVPGFAGLLLWLRRDMLSGQELKPSVWGLALVVLATFLRLGPLYYGFTVADRYSILVTLTGLVLAVGGWAALRWAWPGIAFLLFMLHLPAGVDQWLSSPLRRVTTILSTNALQTFGFFAVSEGNVILLSDSELNVAEACSGLNMLVTFCAMTTAVAVLTPRSVLQKLIIVASSLPLAVICNVVRITLTGAVQELFGEGKTSHLLFHDVAGWLMIFLGLVLLWLELAILKRLFAPAGDGRMALVLPSPTEDAAALRAVGRLRAGTAGR
jgi:exosortase